VGALYAPTRTRWEEGGEYNFMGGMHELRLFWPRLNRRTVDAVRTGQADFALVVSPPVLFLLYQIEGAAAWSDAPYSWHLVPADRRVLPSPVGETEEARDLLQIVLVDAETGIVRALRVVSWSPSFTIAIRLAIAAQAERPWDPSAYHRRLSEIYAAAPTTEHLLRAATARTVGGA
jgi:hypothetical protein